MRSRRKKNSNNNFSSIQFRLDDEPRAVGWTRFASSCGGSQMADSTSRHVKCRIKDGEYFSTPINLVWSEPMRIARWELGVSGDSMPPSKDGAAWQHFKLHNVARHSQRQEISWFISDKSWSWWLHRDSFGWDINFKFDQIQSPPLM